MVISITNLSNFRVHDTQLDHIKESDSVIYKQIAIKSDLNDGITKCWS
jgi:hypothetical protein